MDDRLFTAIHAGAIRCRNRVVMASMSRQRCGRDQVPTSLMATYYGQRASAGLIITEATAVSPGAGNPRTPGIYTGEQVRGWQAVVDAVHARGGCIVLQLSHLGRVSHSSMQPDQRPPPAPSPIQMSGRVETWDGLRPAETPRSLDMPGVRAVVESYRQAARLAREAGFDGIDVLVAGGYLLEQFIRDGSNHRRDAYGGSIRNRARLVEEVLEAVCEIWTPGRVGLHLSPMLAQNDVTDTDPAGTFGCLLECCDRMGLAYVYEMEPGSPDAALVGPWFDSVALRRRFRGTWIVSGGYDAGRARAVLDSGEADMVAFGSALIANPDLVERMRRGAGLNTLDRSALFGGGERGYTDYPFMSTDRQDVRAPGRAS